MASETSEAKSERSPPSSPITTNQHRALPTPTGSRHPASMSLQEPLPVQFGYTNGKLVAPTARKPRISARMRQVIDLLLTGECKTIKAACTRLNLDYSYASRELRKPHIQVFCEQRSRQTLMQGQMRAAARLLELGESDSANVALHATIQTLRIAGISPPDANGQQVNVNVQAGYVIRLREDEPVIDHHAHDEPNLLTDKDNVP